jgi:RimJ/RimL family protein N-acetyltransferase
VICLEQKQEYFDFVNKILDSDFEHVNSRCITSLKSDGTIIGVVVFSRFNRYGCELSIASNTPKFLTRELILVTFHYIFITCGKIRISVLVSCNNEKSLTFTQRMGFIPEARLKRLYGEHDGVVFRMLKEECKWI